MKSIIRTFVFMCGVLLVLSGCSAISTIMMGGSDEAASDVQESPADAPSADDQAVVADSPAERYTFYDSTASW